MTKITLCYKIHWIDRGIFPNRLTVADFKTEVNLNSRSLSTGYKRAIAAANKARIPTIDIIDVELVQNAD